MDTLHIEELKVSSDRVSELPDEILSLTISLLPLREAVSTSILARRWKHIWKTSVKFYSSLSLDVLDMRGSIYSEEMFRYDDESEGEEEDTDEQEGKPTSVLRTETRKFLGWVDQMLQLDYSPIIDSFRLRFHLKRKYAHLIDHWMRFAIARKVQNLDIDLSLFYGALIGYPDEDLYIFPYWLFNQETGSLVQRLYLNTCIFGPLDLQCFSSIVDLQLENTLVKQDLATLLSNAPNLENLCLVKCRELFSLKIFGQSPNLKYLTVISCFAIVNISIDAKNLTRFEYCGAPLEFSFLNVPQLCDVSIRIVWSDMCAALTYALGKLSTDLPKLESLFLTVEPIDESKIPMQLPLFANLKKLILMVLFAQRTLWDFITLVHASPYLQRLELHLVESALDCQEGWRPTEIPHLHLKEILFTGYTGTPHEIEFTKYLLRNAIVLEKITIDSDHKAYSHKLGFHIIGDIEEDEKKELEYVRKELELRVHGQFDPIMRPGVQLLVI